MPDETNQAQDAVAESSGAYGGAASEEQLAEVYLPEGEQQAESGSSSSASTAGESRSGAGAADTEPPAPE
jgi:hypothetical protein